MSYIEWDKQDYYKWHYGFNFPPGQQWGYDKDLKFATNGRGETFHIHGGTKYVDICALINALNKRDWEIHQLKEKLNKPNKGG